MKRALAALLLFGAQPPDGLTLREARSLSPQDLAGRVLGMAGAGYREADIHEGGPFGPRGLAGIAFAGTPSASFPGLCEVDEMWVNFTPIEADSPRLDEPGADPPVRVFRFFPSKTYRIVGDVNRRELSEADWEQLDRACTESGPVLAIDRRRRFFLAPADQPFQAYFGARALQFAIADARTRRLQIASCHEDRYSAGVCADPSRLIAQADDDRLIGVSAAPCPGEVALCAELNFFHANEGNIITSRIVVLRTDQTVLDPPTQSIGIISATIRHETFIED